VPDVNNPGQFTNKGLKGISADTTDPAFTITPANWFAQVQTPAIISSVLALALSSSSPINNATTVLATVHPVLTFNNAILDYQGIALMKADYTLVNAPVTLDSTGKIATIIPSANLTPATVYIIVLAGVSDIYGQLLANQIIKFTVA
jgi:hypothetical protein